MMDDRPTLLAVFSAADAGTPLGQAAPELISVPLDRIVPSRWQPRQTFDAAALLDLANDIAQHGVLTPPLVWQNEDLEYELIAGERRVRASYALLLAARGCQGGDLAKLVKDIAAGGFVRWRQPMQQYVADGKTEAVRRLSAIPCRQVWGKPSQLHELALVDNLQRADLSALEEARALQDLIEEYGYSQRDLAGRLGKSQTWVSQRLNLLHLAPDVAAQVAGGEVDPSTAREIARLAPAAQSVMVAHLQKHGIKSKAAAGLVGRVIELSQPEYYAAAAATDAGGAKRLTYLALGQLSDAGARQAALLRVAGEKSHGQLRPPTEAHEYRDIIAATGMAGPHANRYDVEVGTLWQEHGAAAGYTCANCQINPHRELVASVNELTKAHHETNYFNETNWPKCAPGVSTCQAYTPTGERLALALPFMMSDFVYTKAEKAHMGAYAYGRFTVADVPTWAGILRRKYQQEDERQAQKLDAKQNGLVRALTAYAEAQFSETVEPDHVWAQPCGRCVFHKVGSGDPAKMCGFQANPPAWDNYDTLVARFWQSGNAPAVPRCRLFRLKAPEVNLPDLPGAGVDVCADGLLYLLRNLADREQYGGNTRYAARWLDVKRSNAWDAPTWTNAEPYLARLIETLTPGRRLALLLLWLDPFGWTGAYGNKALEIAAYVPRGGRALTYTLAREIRR